VTFFTSQIETKRLGLLRELIPDATVIAVLINPSQALRCTADLSHSSARRAAQHGRFNDFVACHLLQIFYDFPPSPHPDRQH
jgi:hypothetical protein